MASPEVGAIGTGWYASEIMLESDTISFRMERDCSMAWKVPKGHKYRIKAFYEMSHHSNDQTVLGTFNVGLSLELGHHTLVYFILPSERRRPWPSWLQPPVKRQFVN